jgi:DNA-binding MarR family transcriptional regulator
MASASTGRQRFLLGLFLEAAHAMVTDLVRRLHAAGYTGLRPAHSRLFENLDADGTRLTELAARAQMTRQSMTELVVAMEHAGYVERVPDPEDGRAKLVRLTMRGRAMMRVAVAELAAIQASWLRRMAEAPMALLPEALERALSTDEAAGDAAEQEAPRPPRIRSL